jgi:hypothetical protein
LLIVPEGIVLSPRSLQSGTVPVEDAVAMVVTPVSAAIRSRERLMSLVASASQISPLTSTTTAPSGKFTGAENVPEEAGAVMYREVALGMVSPWVSFGGNPDGATDLAVRLFRR